MIGFTVKCTVGVIECTIEWVVDYNPLHHALATAVRDNVTTNIDRTPTSITGRNSTRHVHYAVLDPFGSTTGRRGNLV